MSTTLVLGELIDNVLTDVSREAVTAAASLGGDVVLGLASTDLSTVVNQLALVGVTQVVSIPVSGSDRDHEQALQVARALVADVQPDLILAGFTIRSAAFAGALAQEFDLALAADVVELASADGAVTATRSIYDGRVRADIAFPTSRPAFVLIRASVWEAAASGPAAPIRTLAVEFAPSRVRAVQLVRPTGDVDLTRSEVIIAVGRGVGGQEGIPLFAEVAAMLGAGLAASRPLVDAGWLPAAHQVGQTGVTVRPRVYVALGISGALHHLAGMRGAQTIIAVNTDKDAPIFGVADIGAVADIHEVAKQLKILI
jgi:electron transfer flavoprotein alpha subunit